MIASWMIYLIAVSAVLVLAALTLEAALSAAGRSTRWPWMAAIAGSVLWPVFVIAGRRYLPEQVGVAAEGAGPVGVTIGQPITFAAPPATMRSMDEPLMAAWMFLTVLLAIVLGISYMRLIQSRREWARTKIGDRTVLLSDNVGPAVVGFFRTSIVLPRWALGVEATLRDLMITHEEEHIGAKDSLLVLGGLTALVIAPWNLPLWWQVRRLRGAIEVDCDARVLRRHRDVRVYGNLLLEVGRRSRDRWFAVAAFSEQNSSLERRIRIMSRNRPPTLTLRLLGSAALSILLFAFACELPEPVGTPNTPPSAPEPRAPAEPVVEAPPAAAEPGPVAAPPISAEPAFTPYETRPYLQNREEFARRLADGYPADLREAGIGGTAVLWVFISKEGDVGNVRLAQSSGHGEIDAVAERVMSSVVFSPAEFHGEPVPVWIQLPVTFSAETMVEPEPAPPAPSPYTSELPLPPAPGTPVGAEPTFTPYEDRPVMENREVFAKYLTDNYPSELREAGVGGTVVLWVFISEAGQVSAIRIAESSGMAGLDEVAQAAMSQATFSPAENRGEPVPVWVQVPVSFQARGSTGGAAG